MMICTTYYNFIGLHEISFYESGHNRSNILRYFHVCHFIHDVYHNFCNTTIKVIMEMSQVCSVVFYRLGLRYV